MLYLGIFGLEYETLHFDKLESADFIYDNNFYKFWHKSTNIRHFLKIKSFFFYMKLFILTNLRVLFWKMTIVFSNSSAKIPTKGNFGPKFIFFYLTWNFAFRWMRRCWFQIWQYFFQIPVQKYPNKAIFVPNLFIFYLTWIFAFWQIRRCWFQIWQQFFRMFT